MRFKTSHTKQGTGLEDTHTHTQGNHLLLNSECNLHLKHFLAVSHM